MVDKKLTELDAITAVTSDDLIYVVDNPTSAVSKKIKVDNFMASAEMGPVAGIPGCLLWFDAGKIAGLSDDDPVTEWRNSVNAHHNLISGIASDPVYKTNIVNSLPVVRFAGAEGMVGDFYGIGGAFTFFMVMKFSSLANAYTCLLRVKFDTDTNALFIKSNGKSAMYWGLLSYDGNGAVTYNDDDWNIVTIIASDKKLFSIRRNLVLDKSITLAYTGYTYSAIGYDPANAGRLLSGDIAEIIAYSRGLSATERDDVEAYINTKYNLGL